MGRRSGVVSRRGVQEERALVGLLSAPELATFRSAHGLASVPGHGPSLRYLLGLLPDADVRGAAPPPDARADDTHRTVESSPAGVGALPPPRHATPSTGRPAPARSPGVPALFAPGGLRISSLPTSTRRARHTSGALGAHQLLGAGRLQPAATAACTSPTRGPRDGCLAHARNCVSRPRQSAASLCRSGDTISPGRSCASRDVVRRSCSRQRKSVEADAHFVRRSTQRGYNDKYIVEQCSLLLLFRASAACPSRVAVA